MSLVDREVSLCDFRHEETDTHVFASSYVYNRQSNGHGVL